MTLKKELRFYHHQKITIMQGLTTMLKRCLQRGDNAIIYCANDEEAVALDEFLWQQEALPHGLISEDYAMHQPILISPIMQEAPNEASVVFFTNIASLVPNEAFAVWPNFNATICCLLFHDSDMAEKDAARHLWKQYPDDTIFTKSYWQQNAKGGWDNKL